MNKLLGAFIFTAMLGWVASIILTAIHFWVIPIIPEGAELRGSYAGYHKQLGIYWFHSTCSNWSRLLHRNDSDGIHMADNKK